MSIEGALDQAAAEHAETVNDGGGEGAAIETQDRSTQGHEGNDLGVKDVPPELQETKKELLRAFHEKTQALADKEKALTGEMANYKQDATALYDLSKQEWFRKAVEAEKARRSGHVAEISSEAFETIKNDPKAFNEFLSNRDKALAEGLKAQFAAEFDRLGKSQQELLSGREVDSVAEKYGQEFVEAKSSNALKPYLDKNFDHETAFKLYMQDQGKVAGKKAEAPPAARKAGAIEKGGMAAARGGPVFKVANLSEALDRAFDLAKRGVKDYRFEKK